MATHRGSGFVPRDAPPLESRDDGRKPDGNKRGDIDQEERAANQVRRPTAA